MLEDKDGKESLDIYYVTGYVETHAEFTATYKDSGITKVASSPAYSMTFMGNDEKMDKRREDFEDGLYQ